MIADCLWNILLLKAPKNGYLNQNCNLLLYIYFSMLKVAQLPLNIQCFKLIPASTHTVSSTSLLEFRLTRWFGTRKKLGRSTIPRSSLGWVHHTNVNIPFVDYVSSGFAGRIVHVCDTIWPTLLTQNNQHRSRDPLKELWVMRAKSLNGHRCRGAWEEKTYSPVHSR